MGRAPLRRVDRDRTVEVMDVVLVDRRTVVDGVDVRVRISRSETLLRNEVVVRHIAVVAAMAPRCGEVTATMRPGAYFFSLGRRRDRIGHAAFDDRYIVKASSREALAYLLADGVADALLATYEPTAVSPFTIELTAHSVLLSAGPQQDPTAAPPRTAAEAEATIPRLDDAIAAAAVVSRRGRALAAAWRTRLEPLGLVDAGEIWAADPGYTATLARGRTPLALDFPWHMEPLVDGRLRTRLAIPWTTAGATIVWRPRGPLGRRPRLADAGKREAPSGWRALATADFVPPRGLADVLDTATPDWLVVADGRLALGWERIEDDPVRLERAIQGLDRLSEVERAAGAGPYR